MSTRRSFITIMPLASISMLAACSDKTAPAPAPAAAPAPAPAAPLPVAEAPKPAGEAAPPAAAPAAAPAPLLDPKDPVAIGLGYVPDAKQADAAKYKTYVAGQACSNCALFGGKTRRVVAQFGRAFHVGRRR